MNALLMLVGMPLVNCESIASSAWIRAEVKSCGPDPIRRLVVSKECQNHIDLVALEYNLSVLPAGSRWRESVKRVCADQIRRRQEYIRLPKMIDDIRWSIWKAMPPWKH
jgi:hypothetical protein